METVGLPVALLYIDKEAFPDMEAKAAEVYGDVPTRFRGQFIFTAVNKKDFGYQLEEYGKGDTGAARAPCCRSVHAVFRRADSNFYAALLRCSRVALMCCFYALILCPAFIPPQV